MLQNRTKRTGVKMLNQLSQFQQRQQQHHRRRRHRWRRQHQRKRQQLQLQWSNKHLTTAFLQIEMQTRQQMQLEPKGLCKVKMRLCARWVVDACGCGTA